MRKVNRILTALMLSGACFAQIRGGGSGGGGGYARSRQWRSTPEDGRRLIQKYIDLARLRRRGFVAVSMTLGYGRSASPHPEPAYTR